MKKALMVIAIGLVTGVAEAAWNDRGNGGETSPGFNNESPVAEVIRATMLEYGFEDPAEAAYWLGIDPAEAATPDSQNDE